MTVVGLASSGTHGSSMETVAGFVTATHPAFALQFRPADMPRAHVVYLPPFAEEMNRCRALVAEQARLFARAGLSCTLLDFYGTGESQGELVDATLPIWRQNIDDLIAELLDQHQCPVYLWGCRLGGLLALDYLGWRPGAASEVLLWQPVASGSAFVNQMLRQRTASLMQKGEQSESTAAMKRQLAAGDAFEVAGYRLGGELLSAIDGIEVASMVERNAIDDSVVIHWLEHVTDETDLPGARTSRVITQLQGTGARVTVRTFTGDPVWQLHKRGACAQLLTRTRELGL